MSRNPYRIAFPRRGWAELRWHHERPLPLEVERLCARAALIPGVRWEEGWAGVDIPITAWAADEVLDLLTVTRTLDTFDRSRPRPRVRDAARLLKLGGGDGLYPWQVRAVLRAFESGLGLLLGDTMGLGKTRTAIVAAEAAARLGGPDRLRVVVGPGFTRDVWLRELLEVGAIDSERDFCALMTRDTYDVSFDFEARWLFVHYEIVHAWASRIVQKRKPIATVVDEVHWCKNPRAQRTKGAHQLCAAADFVMLLTGTPMANRVGELYAPLTMLTGSRSWGSHGDFRQRYAGALRTPYGLQDMEPTHVDELRARMAPYYLRRTVEDTDGHLPPLRRERLDVELDGATLQTHHEIGSQAAVAELVDAVVSGRAGEETLRVLNDLRKITSAAKERATSEYVSNILEQEESVVVFCWQRATAKRLRESLSRHDAVITGEDDQATRDAVVADFQAPGARPTALVATYGVLREGVTLTAARHVVLHDLDWVPSTVLQAEARVWRLGQTRPCTATWVLAADSIDTILARILLVKAAHIEQTLGIDAPARAVDELKLPEIAGWTAIEDWAADMLEGWLG